MQNQVELPRLRPRITLAQNTEFEYDFPDSDFSNNDEQTISV